MPAKTADTNQNKAESGLTFMQLVWIATGQVIGAGVVTITGAAIAVTGRSTWLAYAVAVLFGIIRIIPIIFFCSAMVVPGGTYGVVTRTLGDRTGGLMTISGLVSWTVRGTAVIAIGMYANSVFPFIDGRVAGSVLWTALIIANMYGINMMAKIQSIATPLLLIALMAFSVIGATKLTHNPLNFSDPEFFTGGIGGFGSAVVLLGYSCTGHSLIASLSPKCKNPKKDLPNAMLLTTFIILIAYCAVALVAGGVLPFDEIAGKPLTATAKAVLPPALFIFFMVGGPVFALLTTMNSGISALALPVIAGVKEGWLPMFLAKENRYEVPWISYIIIWVVGILPILANLSIQQITNFVLIMTSITSFMVVVAGFLLPTKFKSEWESSHLHIPLGLYYILIILSALYQIYVIGSSTVFRTES